jgi:hypothetical protein
MAAMSLFPLEGDAPDPAPEIVRPPKCSACEDTGLVAPDVFGDWEPWHKYVAAVRAREEREGWPPEGCAIRAGLINPMPCPVCSQPTSSAR